MSWLQSGHHVVNFSPQWVFPYASDSSQDMPQNTICSPCRGTGAPWLCLRTTSLLFGFLWLFSFVSAFSHSFKLILWLTTFHRQKADRGPKGQGLWGPAPFPQQTCPGREWVCILGVQAGWRGSWTLQSRLDGKQFYWRSLLFLGRKEGEKVLNWSESTPWPSEPLACIPRYTKAAPFLRPSPSCSSLLSLSVCGSGSRDNEKTSIFPWPAPASPTQYSGHSLLWFWGPSPQFRDLPENTSHNNI